MLIILFLFIIVLLLCFCYLFYKYKVLEDDIECLYDNYADLLTNSFKKGVYKNEDNGARSVQNDF